MACSYSRHFDLSPSGKEKKEKECKTQRGGEIKRQRGKKKWNRDRGAVNMKTRERNKRFGDSRGRKREKKRNKKER